MRVEHKGVGLSYLCFFEHDTSACTNPASQYVVSTKAWFGTTDLDGSMPVKDEEWINVHENEPLSDASRQVCTSWFSGYSQTVVPA